MSIPQPFTMFNQLRPISSIIAHSSGNAFILGDNNIVCLDNNLGAHVLLLDQNGKSKSVLAFQDRPIKLLGKLTDETIIFVSESGYATDLMAYIYNVKTQSLIKNVLLGQHSLVSLTYTQRGDVILTENKHLTMPGAESKFYSETRIYNTTQSPSFLNQLFCCNNQANSKKLGLDIDFFNVTSNNRAIAIKENGYNKVEFCLWDLSNLKKLSSSHANIAKITDVYVISEDLILLTLVNHENLIWNIKQNKCIGNLSTANNDLSKITCLKSLSNGDLATGHLNGELKIWDGKSFQCKNTFHEPVGLINSIDQFSNGVILTSSADNTLRIWDNATCLNSTLVANMAPVKNHL